VIANVNRQLGGIRSGDEIRRATRVEELIAREPAPAAHDLVLQHRDVDGGPPNEVASEPQEQQGEFGQRFPSSVVRHP